MTPKPLLQIASIDPRFDARLADFGEVVPYWTAAGRARSAEVAPAIEMVVTSGGRGLDRATMALLPGLRAVASFGVGYDAIDVAAARERGIVVSNTPGVLDDCVADLAFALVLAVMRRTGAAERFVQAGGWLGGAFPLATRVAGKRLGILGLGRIGKVVARRASGFDMEIAYHNRRPDPAVAFPRCDDAVELARWADVLVVLCPGGAATRGLVDAAVLEALGPNGFLVNVSRGSVVDEPALIAALEAGTIAGAGLDVYADEPRVPAALLGRDDVVLLPHVGSATRETRRAMADLTLANVASFVATGRLTTPIAD